MLMLPLNDEGFNTGCSRVRGKARKIKRSSAEVYSELWWWCLHEVGGVDPGPETIFLMLHCSVEGQQNVLWFGPAVVECGNWKTQLVT